MKSKFLVPFETAKALKEKGYNSLCDYYYEPDKQLYFGVIRVSNDKLDYKDCGNCSAPTYHEVVDWLEGRKVRIYAEYCNGWWYGFIDNSETMEVEATVRYQTREEALNVSILKALEML